MVDSQKHYLPLHLGHLEPAGKVDHNTMSLSDEEEVEEEVLVPVFFVLALLFPHCIQDLCQA